MKYLISLLVLINIVLLLVIFSLPNQDLFVIACDVGQGDSILITKGNFQILVDGGPDQKVLDCLSRHLPFWDREIEMVFLTHPDKDHSYGLIEVFKRYKVTNYYDNFYQNEKAHISTSNYQLLEKLVGSSGTSIHQATTGLKLQYGLILLDILNPALEAVANNTYKNINDFSITFNLTYGKFSGLFTGDLGHDGIAAIIKNNGFNNVDYLKVPHHGSKNNLTQEMLDLVNPGIAVISVGKNSYGHPHQEILEMLNAKKVNILRTDQLGDVVLETDGSTWWIK